MGMPVYASILKSLLKFTKTHSTQLANYVEYDISYISKWSNGAKLPSSRSIEEVNDKMGRYFADIIKKTQREDEFRNVFSLHMSDDLASEITQCLSRAYRNSIQKPSISSENKSAIHILRDGQALASLLADLLKKGGDSTQDLLIAGDFCTLCDAKFWSGLNAVSVNTPLHVSVLLNLDKAAENLTYIHALYTALNENIAWDFTIYPLSALDSSNLIIVRNRFALQYSFLPAGDMLCTCIESLSVVQSLYEKCEPGKTFQPPLLHSAKAPWSLDSGYRTSFYATRKFFFFLTNGIEYLLPPEVFSNIQQIVPDSEKGIIERLRITWEEIVNTSELSIMLPSSSVMRYLETGSIDLTDIHYRLSPQERQAHIVKILDCLKKNPHITLGVLSSLPNTLPNHKNNLAFYSNYKASFFKKNPDTISADTNAFYIVASSQLNELFLRFFRNLTTLPMYHEYTEKELTQKYEVYKPFIDKVLSLDTSC